MGSFHRLAHEPALMNLFTSLLGGAVFPQPRNIARIIAPHKDLMPTPAHQDHALIQGDINTWTAWFPLGDCPRELGGLSVLEGSHKAGLLDVTKNKGSGRLESILCDLNYEWVDGDFQAGDVLVFHSFTVHKALPRTNSNSDKIRISCDFRYQPVNTSLVSNALKPHGSKDGDWEVFYKDWKNDDLKYCWKKYNLTLSDWDESIQMTKEKFC